MWLFGIQTLPPEMAEVPPKKGVFSMSREVRPWWWARREASRPAAPAPIMRMSHCEPKSRGGVSHLLGLLGVMFGGELMMGGCDELGEGVEDAMTLSE